MIDLTGYVALVTGSSRGIGAACAVRLAEAGADIILNYCTSRSAADQVAEQIQALGRRVAVVKADVSERDDIESLIDFIEERFGRLDIIVSNAASGGFRSMMSITPQNFVGTMKTNVLALIQLVQVASKLLEKSPGRAKVIGLSSHGAAMAVPMYGSVGGSKAALESFARHLALELGDRGINVNIVRAGLVATDSTSKLPYADMMFEGRKWRSMTGDRFVEKEDVANAVLFLASPLSDMVQGETLTVDCGAQVHV
ncbi:SDR family oxidoreductase [Bythopirellula polymerisocia]|uniref:Enoyl-[acyl-carrier-protein] reductase [NADPH] FabL n=1 Tax=Bythopirellula polymerisocia TaxID=2528003 RepID=A0A5C6CSI6_9BACT|nr:SDR family oxidoreductase [Bythopirellula polymerisocia]TWU26046.1 Enoyl-[acyl-carrier-protein] reductase [NADPH] FabL [Bythopirellula polymerisocia]